MLRPREGEKEEAVRARAVWSDGKDATEALRAFPRWMHAERAVLEGYARRGGSNHLQAMKHVPHNMRLMYLHAYQARARPLPASLPSGSGRPPAAA